jgi:hypothetical protein
VKEDLPSQMILQGEWIFFVAGAERNFFQARAEIRKKHSINYATFMLIGA